MEALVKGIFLVNFTHSSKLMMRIIRAILNTIFYEDSWNLFFSRAYMTFVKKTSNGLLRSRFHSPQKERTRRIFF